MIPAGRAHPTPGGYVSFVGAGPGDPELITLKALRRLREADVVVHDRLVCRALLEEAPAGAEIVDVGKAPGRLCVAQDAIDRLVIERAGRGARVVRLKGGDPTIFGRLAEEIRAVRAAGLAFEVIPGVTAATAAAASAGVSLTDRATASLVVLATGTDHHGRRPAGNDWELLARVEGTLVFYMAVAGLDALTSELVACGRDPHQPALIVQAAGTIDEQKVVGTLADIAVAARAAAIESPALLVIGPTVDAAGTRTPDAQMAAGERAVAEALAMVRSRVGGRGRG